jgi:hypothetical protein
MIKFIAILSVFVAIAGQSMAQVPTVPELVMLPSQHHQDLTVPGFYPLNKLRNRELLLSSKW